MALYKRPILGKIGVYSNVSGQMVFGICADSKKECLQALQARIGSDVCKYRWSFKPWTLRHLHLYNLQKTQYLEYRKIQAQRRKEFEIAREYINCAEWLFTSNQMEKFKKSGRYPATIYNYKDSLKLFFDILSGEAYKEK